MVMMALVPGGQEGREETSLRDPDAAAAVSPASPPLECAARNRAARRDGGSGATTPATAHLRREEVTRRAGKAERRCGA